LYWLDPILTILISLYILKEAYNITKEAIEVLMMSAPDGIDIKEIQREIETLPDVINIHHLHIWKLTDNQIHFESHIEVNDTLISNLMPLKEEIEKLLEHNYGISHSTVQFEISQCENILV